MKKDDGFHGVEKSYYCQAIKVGRERPSRAANSNHGLDLEKPIAVEVACRPYQSCRSDAGRCHAMPCEHKEKG